MYSCRMQGGKNAENSRRKIFVGGLPATVTENQLKEYFSRYGQVCCQVSSLFLLCFTVYMTLKFIEIVDCAIQ